MHTFRYMLFFLLLCCIHVPYSMALPAFPGAEGFGSDTIGGRGGAVIHVTTLLDNGDNNSPLHGSFREAVRASGPRIIVFDVSGIVYLHSPLIVEEPFVTIAGQTSPGGVSTAGFPVAIWAHDVIMRHIRIRTGSNEIVYERGTAEDPDGEGAIVCYDNMYQNCNAGNKVPCSTPGVPHVLRKNGLCDNTDYVGVDPETLDSFYVAGPAMPGWFPGAAGYNIIIDHCSFSWGVDETFSFVTGTHNVTIQWSSIFEGLSYAGHPKGEHSKGMLCSFKYGGVREISIHHNYFANSKARQPLISGRGGAVVEDIYNNWLDFRNNVTLLGPYNGNATFENNGRGNAVNNWMQPSSETRTTALGWSYWGTPFADNYLYLKGNKGTQNENSSAPDWAINDEWREGAAPIEYRRNTPYPVPSAYLPKTFEATAEFAECVVAAVGATAPVIDSVDQRMRNEWKTGSFHVPNNIRYPDDYPSYPNPPPPLDTDLDGMPDEWELEHGLRPEQNDAAAYSNGNQYTNIEMYINKMAEKSILWDPVCMPGNNQKSQKMNILYYILPTIGRAQ